jgi:molecular chaperone DnaJ
MRVPLRDTQAALGGDVEVPAIDGSKAKVKISPPGTQTGGSARSARCKWVFGASSRRAAIHPGVGGDAAEPSHHAASTSCWRSSRPRRSHGKGSPESEGFFSKVKEFFEGGRG